MPRRTTPRPEKIQCERCDAWVEQQSLGAPRRVCDDCQRTKTNERRDAWKKAHPEEHRRHNRESARRRRRDGRLT
jgi:hypothetical protein